MLLIDSLYINTGGGKTLLNYLVEQCENAKLNVFYLFDDRCSQDYNDIPNERKCFIKASLQNRHQFYKKESHKFQFILCFGNLPPTIKIKKATVYTYFHQLLFIRTEGNLSFLGKLKLNLKKSVLSYLKKNTDFWLVQQSIIRDGLSSVYDIDKKKILTLPFYPPIRNDGQNYQREPSSFVYVSSGAPHKNHDRLIEAFCLFYDQNKEGLLTLTVSSSAKALCSKIEEKQNRGYPIQNLGFIDRDKLYEVYNTHQFLIFPSLAESFGLGIVEAIENGCNVIGADLPYLYEVCKPSLTFSPTSIESIKKSLEKARKKEYLASEARISNNIDKLLKLLE